jgi:hypothetical protein
LSNIYSLQEGGVHFVEPPKRQRLSKSLLSGSERSFSGRSESEGGSCDTAPYSKPYLLQSAADAASAAIDYSKGDVEDGVVDSPPSRGPGITPICSPSPLKRAVSSRGYCFSPKPRTDSPMSRKLILPLDEAPGHPRLDDGVPPPSVLRVVHIDGLKSTAALEDRTGNRLPRSATDVTVRRVQDEQPLPSQSTGAIPSADSIRRLHFIREFPRSLQPKPTDFSLPRTKNVIASPQRPPPRGSRSLSASDAPQITRRSKRKVSGAQSLSVCDAWAGGSGSHYRSRRKDILRGLAKLKAEEAARINRTELDK